MVVANPRELHGDELWKKLSEETVGVYGYGRTGKAVVNALSGQTAKLLILDDQLESIKETGHEEIETSTENHPIADLDRLIVSPGVPMENSHIQRAQTLGIPIWGEIELAYRLLIEKPIWAVTGTNGKSTCVELIGNFLSAQGRTPFVGGNRGAPLIGIVGEEERYTDYVVEISTFQIETLDSFQAERVLLTNLGDDHVDRHGSLRRYHQLKWDLVSRTRTEGVAVVPGQRKPPLLIEAPILPCGNTSVEGRDYGLEWTSEGLEIADDHIPGADIPIVLRLFPQNLLGTLALVGDHPDVTWIRNGLNCFEPLPYRAEPIEISEDRVVINDSKATNPDAVQALVKQIEVPFRILLGGAGKDADFSPLMAELTNCSVEEIVTCGDERLTNQLLYLSRERGLDVREETDWKYAVQSLIENSSSGERILLSPGGTSFDAFENYKERGRAFQEWVREAVQS